MDLVNEANESQSRRQEVVSRSERAERPQQKKFSRIIQEAIADLARLDIVDWLARGGLNIPSQWKTSHGAESPFQSGGVSRTVIVGVTGPTAVHPELHDDWTLRSLDDAYESRESVSEGVEAGDEFETQSGTESVSQRSEGREPGDDSPHSSEADQGASSSVGAKEGGGAGGHRESEPQPQRSMRGDQSRDPLRRPSPIQQVEILARAVSSAWPEIASELNGRKNVKDVKRQLANHGWCDLFIGLAQAIEKYQDVLTRIPDSAKRFVKYAILHSSIQSERPDLTSAVVDIVVDKAWKAFKGAAFGQFPLLQILDSADLLRSLRILAVFTCPAPEVHKEVREHALKPLGEDVRAILTAQTKIRLENSFSEWVAAGNYVIPADRASVIP